MAFVNPLKFFGVPEWFIEEELRGGSIDTAGLERIRDVAKRVYQGLARIYHPDMGSRADPEKFKYISGLYEALASLPTVEILAKQMIDTGSLYTEQARRLVAEAERQSRSRLEAMLGMINVIDQEALLGRPLPVELVFGLPLDQANGPQVSYDMTFALPLEVGDGMLSSLRHPHDLVVEPFTYNEPVTWDAERQSWVARYFPNVAAMEVGGSGPIQHLFGAGVPLDRVRLVGGLPEGAFYRMAAAVLRPIEERLAELPSGGTPVSPSGPTWLPVEKAWWLSELKPSIAMGDFAVVVRSRTATPTLAIVGRLIATRALA